MHASRSQRGGFTLIEVLIALAIAVSLAALMLPMMKRPGAEDRLLQDADRIRLIVERAKDRTRRDGSARSLTAVRSQDGRWSVTATPVTFGDSVEGQTPGSTDDAATVWAVLLPDGSAIESSPLRLTGADTRDLALQISPLTAATSWEWIPPATEPQQ